MIGSGTLALYSVKNSKGSEKNKLKQMSNSGSQWKCEKVQVDVSVHWQVRKMMMLIMTEIFVFYFRFRIVCFSPYVVAVLSKEYITDISTDSNNVIPRTAK